MIAAVLALLFVACTDEPAPQPVSVTEQGIYILNEGSVTFNNASLSLYAPDSGFTENNIFEKVNGVPLGDIGQSMQIYGDNMFIVVNNSGKVYITDKNTAEFKGKITGLTSPRYIAIANNELAYISDLYDSLITIFNPGTFEKTGSIHLGRTSEQLLIKDGYLYVISWSFDRMLSKIDIATNEVVHSLNVGLQPQSMVEDINGMLWILCDGGYAGNPAGHEHPRLVCVNPASMEIMKNHEFPMSNYPLSDLCMNAAGDQLYFINKDVYSLSIYDTQLPNEPLLEQGSKNIYSIGIHPGSNNIYIGDAATYVQQGMVFRYDEFANLLDSFYVGINPGFFGFRAE